METDADEVKKINPSYFDLKDLAKAKEMLGELLYNICPLPLDSIPAHEHCPLHIRSSYIKSFFPPKEDFHGIGLAKKSKKKREKEGQGRQ